MGRDCTSLAHKKLLQSLEKFREVRRFLCSSFERTSPVRKPATQHAQYPLRFSCGLLRSTHGRSTAKKTSHLLIYRHFGGSSSPEPRCLKNSVLTKLGSDCSGIWKRTYRRRERTEHEIPALRPHNLRHDCPGCLSLWPHPSTGSIWHSNYWLYSTSPCIACNDTGCRIATELAQDCCFNSAHGGAIQLG